MKRAGHPSCPTQAFTLIELLAVIAILAVLASLLFPSLTSARAKAQSVRCGGNLRQCSIWLNMLAGDNNGGIRSAAQWIDTRTGDSMPGPGANSCFMTWTGWLTGEQYQGLLKGLPTYATDYRAFLCPMQNPPSYSPSNSLIYRTYGMLHGGNLNGRNVADWNYGGFNRLSAVPDMSSTPLLADTVTFAGGAMGLQMYYFHSTAFPENSGVHLRHSGKANVVFFDGHVQSLDQDQLNGMGVKNTVSATFAPQAL